MQVRRSRLCSESCQPGTENAKQGKYTIRVQTEEKGFHYQIGCLLKRDKKVGAAKALQVIGEAHAHFKGVSSVLCEIGGQLMH